MPDKIKEPKEKLTKAPAKIYVLIPKEKSEHPFAMSVRLTKKAAKVDLDTTYDSHVATYVLETK